jgi:hypothetical protein
MSGSTDGRIDRSASARAVAAIADAVVSHANDSGGWGYVPGTSSRLEPSCWVLLALSGDDDQLSLERHRPFFERCWRSGNVLIDQEGAPPNYTHNALALLTFLQHHGLGSAGRTQALLSAVVAAVGVRTANSPVIRQNSMLAGWSWIPETFSWVEPTSWCVLALKRAMKTMSVPGARERIAEAEKLLVDRCCVSGGWNYGNSNVLGANLPAYVSTTAIALLALQDRRDLPEVAKSLAFLERRATAEPSGMALSLALLCARVYGRPVAELEDALISQWHRTAFLQNSHTLGLALCALTPRTQAVGALTV